MLDTLGHQMTKPEIEMMIWEVDENFDDVISWIDGTLVDEPPLAIKDGGIVREGYDEELDKLRAMTNTGREWLQHLQKALSFLRKFYASSAKMK